MANKDMQGEGNREADRRYREGVTEAAGTAENEKAARKAKEAIEGDEAEELAKAEARARNRSEPDRA